MYYNQFIADSIDQLDLALDQIAVNDRNFDRFAMLLIDNVVELTLHEYASGKASENARWSSFGTPTHDPNVIQQATSQSFDKKVKGVAKLGLFDDEIKDSLLNLHAYRNTAYHQGRRHEGVMHALAIFYLRNACKVLLAYDPRVWGTYGESISYRARKYLGSPQMEECSTASRDALTRLDMVAASLPQALTDDLASDMERMIEDANEMLDFLSNDAPTKQSRDEAIRHAQAWRIMFADEGVAFSRENGYAGNSAAEYIEWFMKNYNWPVPVDPVPGWRYRLQSLRAEMNPHKALGKYSEFIRQTKSIREQLSVATEKLDEYIDEQIDMR